MKKIFLMSDSDPIFTPAQAVGLALYNAYESDELTISLQAGRRILHQLNSMGWQVVYVDVHDPDRFQADDVNVRSIFREQDNANVRRVFREQEDLPDDEG